VSRKDIMEFGKAFDQHSVIFKDDKEFVLIGTNSSSGFGQTITTFVRGGKSNMNMAKEAIKDFFSALAKGSHSGSMLKRENRGLSIKQHIQIVVKNQSGSPSSMTNN
jgi:hypothetical protein